MSNEKPIKELIDKLLRAYGYQDQLDEIELIKLFEEAVGVMYMKHMQKIYFKDKKLFVKLDSAALKQELNYSKEAIMHKLNQRMRKRIVQEIVIH
jgi:hypothetical protein